MLPMTHSQRHGDCTKEYTSSDEETQLLDHSPHIVLEHGRLIRVFSLLGTIGLLIAVAGYKVWTSKRMGNFANVDNVISEVGASITCPGSPASMHAGMKLSAVADTTCSAVKSEAKARVEGKNGWTDPHNKGTYTEVEQVDDGVDMSFSRLTGDRKFTDKMVFTLTDIGSKCKIDACSESQGGSNEDFSTNYCNLKMLFCGSDDQCHPVIHDFTSSGETTKQIAGASATMQDCFNGPQI